MEKMIYTPPYNHPRYGQTVIRRSQFTNVYGKDVSAVSFKLTSGRWSTRTSLVYSVHLVPHGSNS